MYAYFIRQGRFLRYYREEAEGMELLRCQLPRRGREERWQKRCLPFLRRAGVCGLLNGAALPGLKPISTGALYRRRAAELALLALSTAGVPAREAVVGVRGSRWTREMAAACDALAGQVKALSLNLPHREEAEQSLREKWGVPVLAGDGIVTLCFMPDEAAPGRLLLGEERPSLPGIEFVPEHMTLPEGCPAEPFCAALGQPERWGRFVRAQTAERFVEEPVCRCYNDV